MNNLKSYILLIFLFTFSLNTYSQKNYGSGYIITNQNDTIYGFLKDRKPPPFGKLYSKIRFKEKSNSVFAKKYSPYQISGYKINNVEYESKWIKVDRFFLKEDYKCIENCGEKAFLKVIVKGYLTYYQWEYIDGESGYIDAVDLLNKQNENIYIKATQGVFGLKKDKLAAYFMDCPELAKQILTKQIKDPISVANFYNKYINNNN
ncbi:MAG: hypothetical protein JXL97_04155 [Bacteroidales bacterium]|nr:hypothetical protein [Bacteroidales bacterium]